MTSVADVLSCLCGLAPLSGCVEHDNVGLLAGDPLMPVTKILVSLDVSMEAIEEAKKLGCELIAAHHPLIYRPLYSVTPENPTAVRVAALIKHDIAAICMHTNLDATDGGVADCLANAAGLSSIKKLPGEPTGIMRVGEFEEALSLQRFMEKLKQALCAPQLRFVSAQKPVRRVAVGSGGGYGVPPEVVANGCDTLLVGEAGYHDFCNAPLMGLNLVEAGHFFSEDVAMEPLRLKLSERFPDVKVMKSVENICPIRIF